MASSNEGCIVEATDDQHGETVYIQTDSSEWLWKLLRSTHLGITFPNNATYVFRKMSIEEFEQTVASQKLAPILISEGKKKGMTKEQVKKWMGEKWISESMEHSRKFQNEGASGPEVVAEFAVEKKSYKGIRDNAIPQRESSVRQPIGATPLNIYNKELIEHVPGKINLGLKGNENVDHFNQHVINVSEIDPNSYANKNDVLKWIRRNKLKTSAIILGIALDAGHLIMSIIKDDGSFGESTQLSVADIVGNVIGNKAAIKLAELLGAAIGTNIPALGYAVIGLIGGLIGEIVGRGIVKLARYLFCVAPLVSETDKSTSDTDASLDVPNTALEY